MWKLGLNKAPVGQSPRQRAIPRNELVQLELRGQCCHNTHTTALNNPQVLHNDVSNRHAKINAQVKITWERSLWYFHIKWMIICRQHGCLNRYERSYAKRCLKPTHTVIFILTYKHLFFTFSWLILSCSLSSDWTLRSSTSSRKCWRCLDDSSSSSLRHASNSRAEAPLNSYSSKHVSLFNSTIT